MDLVEFLNARLDEEAAPRAIPAWHEPWCLSPEPGECGYCGAVEDPTQVEYMPQPPKALAQVDAKRRILAAYVDSCDFDHLDSPYHLGVHAALGAVVELLALPYADHADYDEAWRP